MGLKPDDLVLVHVEAPFEDHKNADWWEEAPHWEISQLADQPVFQVQPMDAVADENIGVVHRNMLFPVQSVTSPDSLTVNNDKYFALMKANLLMDLHFNN